MLAWLHFINALLNHWFAGPVDALLAGFHIVPAHPSRPIDNTFTLELIVFAVLVLFFFVVRLSLSVEKPGAAQHIAEIVHEFVAGQADQVMGHGYDRFMPVVTSILLFILLCNLCGLLPGIDTPTATPAVPFGLAIFTFVFYNLVGLRKNGPIGYFKHFLGPVWWIAPLMFPIEIISHFARMLSLTVRLYANMLASDLITIIFFSMIPLALPILGLGLHAFVAIMQAYVFMLLNIIYLAEATAHAEEH